jgi:hypothetical protein
MLLLRHDVFRSWNAWSSAGLVGSRSNYTAEESGREQDKSSESNDWQHFV